MCRRALVVICLLLSAGPALAVPRWQRAPPPPPMPPADESGFAEVNGISMFYSLYGKGRGSPILLVHGGLSSGDVWSFEVPTLARDHEVIPGARLVVLKGVGHPAQSQDPQQYLRAIEDFMGG